MHQLLKSPRLIKIICICKLASLLQESFSSSSRFSQFGIIKPLRNLTSNRSSSRSQQVQSYESKNRTQIKSENRRNDISEEIKIRIGDRKDRLEDTNGLCLGEPGEQYTSSNHKVVNLKKVPKSSYEYLFSDSIPGDGHCEGGISVGEG